MQRLKEKLAGTPFAILAVNMAEEEATVRAFLDKVPVDFAALMDRDGSALKQWKVFVFPTSFLIGPDGKIRYGLSGAFEWDGADVLKAIEELMPAQPGR